MLANSILWTEAQRWLLHRVYGYLNRVNFLVATIASGQIQLKRNWIGYCWIYITYRKCIGAAVNTPIYGYIALIQVLNLPLIQNQILFRHDVVAPDDSGARADGDTFWQMCFLEGELGDLMGVGVEGAAL